MFSRIFLLTIASGRLVASLVFLASVTILSGLSEAVERPDAVYHLVWRTGMSPGLNDESARNPPAFLWPRTLGARYQVEVSQDPSFTEITLNSSVTRHAFYVPDIRLQRGTWFWRLKVISANGTVVTGQTIPFRITEKTVEYPEINPGALFENIPDEKPFLSTWGSSLSDFRNRASSMVASKNKVTEAADRAMASPVTGTGEQPWKIRELIYGYLASGDQKYMDEAKRRMAEVEKNIGNGTGTNVIGGFVLGLTISVMAELYDASYNESSDEERARYENYMTNWIQGAYNAWPNNREAVMADNHFWQTELSCLMMVAMALKNKNPEYMKKCFEYSVGVYLARAPTSSGNGGGWSQGLGYFGLEAIGLVDIAVHLKSLGADLSGTPWFRNTAKYLLYNSYPSSLSNGFGDMHERIGSTGDKLADFVFYSNGDSYAGELVRKRGQWLSGMQQIALNINNEPLPAMLQESELPKAICAPEIGEVTMHTRALTSSSDLALFFRSSPFGAYSHAHANQNCFNLAYKNQRIFWSVGYYDNAAHSYWDYKSTRAHNGIVIDGESGQGFGSDSYGRIARFYTGRNLSYVKGDAKYSYRLGNAWLYNRYTEAEKLLYFGDKKLQKFDRHILNTHDGLIVIYDDLESEEERQSWTARFHTDKTKMWSRTGDNRYGYSVAAARGVVPYAAEIAFFGSSPIELSTTTGFLVRPTNFGNDPNPPLPMNISCTQNSGRSKRFLSIIQCKDTTAGILPIVRISDSEFRVGNTTIRAVMDVDAEAGISVVNNSIDGRFGSFGDSESQEDIITEEPQSTSPVVSRIVDMPIAVNRLTPNKIYDYVPVVPTAFNAEVQGQYVLNHLGSPQDVEPDIFNDLIGNVCGMKLYRAYQGDPANGGLPKIGSMWSQDVPVNPGWYKIFFLVAGDRQMLKSASLFIDAAPTISSLSPASGSASGGTTVTITGANLTGTTAVTFGGIAAANVTVVSATSLTCTAPAHAAGAVHVALTTTQGVFTKADGFAYVAEETPGPTVTQLSPDRGAAAGGTLVTVVGTGLAGASEVRFGGALATDVVVIDAATVQCRTPAGTAGIVPVTITTGSAQAAASYRYVGPPVLTTLHPASGPSTGGTMVTITGGQFVDVPSVTFGDLPATQVVLVDEQTCTCVTPTQAAGPVQVKIQTSFGAVMREQGFTFDAAREGKVVPDSASGSCGAGNGLASLLFGLVLPLLAWRRRRVL